MPEFGKRQNITCVKCRGSENVKTKRMLNAGARETSKQMAGDFPGARETSKQTVGDFPGLGKRHSKRRDEKQETCFNHLIKKRNLLWKTKVRPRARLDASL